MRAQLRPARLVAAVVTAAAVSTAVFVQASSGASAPAAAVAAPADLTHRLAARQVVFADVAAPPGAVGVAAALRTARMSTAGTADAVYAGVVTDLTQHVGDGSTPLAVERRPVYAVHFRDVEFRMHTRVDATVVMDKVVFVDALTGAYLWGMSV